jgi:hypothetical protein
MKNNLLCDGQPAGDDQAGLKSKKMSGQMQQK